MKDTEKIELIDIQIAFMDAGYQWEESIYNDGHKDNCYIVFAKDKDPTYLAKNVLGVAGWGRYERLTAWRKAYEWMKKEK